MADACSRFLMVFAQIVIGSELFTSSVMSAIVLLFSVDFVAIRQILLSILGVVFLFVPDLELG